MNSGDNGAQITRLRDDRCNFFDGPGIQTRMVRRSLGIALFLCAFACKSPEADDAAGGETSSEATGGDETCPLTPAARQVVAEMVTDLVGEISWVTVHSVGPQEAPFALSLVGTSLGNVGSAFLIEECTAPLQYDA